MYELLNDNLELIAYGSYSNLETMAQVEHLESYATIPAYNGAV